MNTKSLEEIVRDRIFRLNGKEAQKLTWDILIFHYPDLQTPAMQHDLGNDGYTIDGQTFFASYFTESGQYDNKETKDKISEDYKKYITNWYPQLKGKVTKWVFITKANLQGIPHQEIATLNANDDGTKKEQYGLEQLVNLGMQIPTDRLKRIFNITEDTNQHFENSGVNYGTQISAKNVYMQTEKEEQKEISIIDEIFAHVLEKLKTYKRDPEDGYINLEEKIVLNFANEKDRDAVKNYFTLALLKMKLIETKIKEEDTEIQNDLQSHIFGKYYELRTQNKSTMEILHELFNIFIPQQRERDSAYINLAKAFVLFYFEDCSIFEKTEAERKKKS